MNQLEEIIESAWNDREKLKDPRVREAIETTLRLLDSGEIRVAQKSNGAWQTNAWVKKGILLYFPIAEMKTYQFGPFETYDKLPLKSGLQKAGVRAVPGAVVRYSSFVESGAILLPSFVNVGARVGTGTMIDTWATVGSCAQVGANCHIAGGVGIGGVLEPPSANPVIIEDYCFIGSRCIVVEGSLIEEGSVLGANTVITASTPIIDVTGETEIVYKGRVPANSVVIPGVRQKKFAAGTYGLPCALIIGKRSAETDRKTSLNAVLRDYSVPV
ncbi:MAG: 2,3,4,5-tetrahydropyridine-2,6-dicarboxylate N-succinyltransferase [Planctomycetota bacterium]